MSKLKIHQVEQILDEDAYFEESIPRCFFSKDIFHLHPKGMCMRCDWQRQANESYGWDDPKFIEFWDYKNYWHNNVKGDFHL